MLQYRRGFTYRKNFTRMAVVDTEPQDEARMQPFGREQLSTRAMGGRCECWGGRVHRRSIMP